MFWVIAGVLLGLWGIGMLTGTTYGGVVHLLLILAVLSLGVEIYLEAKERLAKTTKAPA